MSEYGLLIDYDYCTGCHSCEAACRVEHGFDKGLNGIQLFTIGPRSIGKNKWEFTNIPVPTDLCDLCAERVALGKMPTCVHHCQALVMEFDTVEELSRKLDKRKKVLFTLD